MPYTKPHFIWDDRKEEVDSLARHLVKEFGEVSIDDCDVIVSIGGDGTLIYALDQAVGKGKAFYGLTAADTTTSRGFLTDHDVRTADDLREKLANAYETPLPALKGEIRFESGKVITEYTHTDIVIKAHMSDRLQAASLDVSAIFNDTSGSKPATHQTMRIAADGIIFSTPISTTGYSASNHAAPVDLTLSSITLSGIAAYEPLGLRSNPPVFSPQTQFQVVPPPKSYDKRKLGVLIGGSNEFHTAERENDPIVEIRIEAVPEKEGVLLTSKHPSMLAFESLRNN